MKKRKSTTNMTDHVRLPKTFQLSRKQVAEWKAAAKVPMSRSLFIQALHENIRKFVPGKKVAAQDVEALYDAFLCTLAEQVVSKGRSIKLGDLGTLYLATHGPCRRKVIFRWEMVDGKKKLVKRWASIAPKRIVKLRGNYAMYVDRDGQELKNGVLYDVEDAEE